MRILWHSAGPWGNGGYGVQTGLFIRRLQGQGHTIALIAMDGVINGVIKWEGVTVFPRSIDPGSQDAIPVHSVRFKPDILITLSDAYGYSTRAFRQLLDGSLYPRWVAWFPIDNDPMQEANFAAVSNAWQPVVMSRFGERVAREAGLNPLYVPHGVETNIYTPTDRTLARRALGWPEDRFIVGMVAGNGKFLDEKIGEGFKGFSRKAITEQVTAFARFKRSHPDALLCLHMEPVGGVNVVALCEELDLRFTERGHAAADVFLCDLYNIWVGYSFEEMALRYNAFDVLLMVTKGEGFGVPIIEAQACGTPVIIGDWTAMSELLFAGWKVTKDEATLQGELGIFGQWWHPNVDAITDRLEMAYRSIKAGNETKLRSVARAGALEYDADLITGKYWKPVLAEIETRINRGGRPHILSDYSSLCGVIR